MKKASSRNTRTASIPPDERWRSFWESWGAEVAAKLDRVSHLIVDAHRPSEGNYREVLVRQLLRRLLPGRYRVSTGFVVDRSKFVSRQMDVIIWDALDCAPLLEEGEFAVLADDSVKALIEVKTRLTPDELRSALAVLHPPRYVEWWHSEPPTTFDLAAERTSPPIRGVIGFHAGNGFRKDTGRRVLETIRDFYRTKYGNELSRVLQQGSGHSPMTAANMIDVVAVGGELELEQRMLTFVDAHGEFLPKGGYAWLCHDFSKAGSPNGGLARFCLSVSALVQGSPGFKSIAGQETRGRAPFGATAAVVMEPVDAMPAAFAPSGTIRLQRDQVICDLKNAKPRRSAGRLKAQSAKNRGDAVEARRARQAEDS